VPSFSPMHSNMEQLDISFYRELKKDLIEECGKLGSVAKVKVFEVRLF